MSEKRFTYGSDVYWVKDNYKNVELLPIDVLILLNEQDNELDKYRTENAELHITILEIEKKVGEQQATIKQLEKNYDDLVQWASQIAKRNVLLDEKIGKLQKELQKQ